MARTSMRSASLVVFVALSSACQVDGQADDDIGETDESETDGDESGESTSDESETSSDESETDESETGTETEGGDPLWAIVEAFELDGEINQVWAVDLADPAAVGETEILVLDSNYGGTGLQESTPWGTHLVRYLYLDDWTTRQIRLDEQGQPQVAAFVPPEIEGLVQWPQFSADGSRALVQANTFSNYQLWTIDFDAGEPIGAELITSVDGEDVSFPDRAITPDGSAVLWSTIEYEFDDGGPLMMMQLEPEPGPAMQLSNSDLWGMSLQVDKLIYFTDEDLDEVLESWLLPIDDLLAPPVPGPTMPSLAAWSSDGQRVVFRNGLDQLGMIEFTGLSFGAPQPIDAPMVMGWDLALGDAIVYGTGANPFELDAFMMIDLSSGTPSAPLPLTSAADSVVGYILSPGKQWFGYRAEDPNGYRLEVTDISGPTPATPLILLDQVDTASPASLQFVDDQHVLVIGATGSGPADLYVVDLAADPLVPVPLTTSIPAEQGIDYTLTLTPALDSVLFQSSEPGSNTSDFLWRTGTGGRPLAEQLSFDPGWEIGRIETLPIGP